MTDKKTYLPDVAEYERAVNKAQTEWDRRSAELHEMYPLRYAWGTEEERQQYKAHSTQCDEYHERYTKALYAAIGGLHRAGDPLVKWIAKHCLEDYQDEALQVLRALPATVDELNKLAFEQGWCSVWADFRDKAIEAGVLADERPPAMRALDWWITRNLSISEHRRAELDKKIAAALVEARTLAAESA